MSEQDGTSEADDTEQQAGESADGATDTDSDGAASEGERSSEASTPSERASDDPRSKSEAADDGQRESGDATADESPQDGVPDSEQVAYDTDQQGDLDVADDIVEYVESTPNEEVADEIATLRFEVDTLESDVEEYEQEIEELKSRLKRKQADFENYKKRMEKRREQEQARATENLVKRLLDVRDNLKRALEQDDDTDIRDGIESTLKQFDRVLEDENVEAIEPEPGDDVDPERHEVLVRMDSEQPPGTIAQVHRPGYEMAGKVIRTAQVAVSEE